MTTRKELDQLAIVVNNQQRDALDTVDYYYIQGAYGRVRLVRDQGSVEVSPSLTQSELESWIRAYIKGITDGRALWHPR